MAFLYRFHPTIFVTTAFMMGTWWKASLANQLPIMLFATALIISIKITENKKTKLLFSALLCFFFFLGATLYFLQQNNHSLTQEQLCGKKWNLRGTVTAKEKSKQRFAKQIITFTISETEKTENSNGWSKTTGNINLYLQKESKLNVGDYIELHDIFLKKPNNKSLNLFFIKINVVATAFEKNANYTLLSSSWNFSKWLSLKKESLYHSLRAYPKIPAILKSLNEQAI